MSMRIKDKFIIPLNEFYGGKLNDKQSDIYADKLKAFDNPTLEKAVDWLMENHSARYFPALPKCIDACRACVGMPQADYDNYDFGEPQQGTVVDCEHAMRSPEGQFALKEGYGRDVWVTIKYDKRAKLDKVFFQKCRQGLKSFQEGCNTIAREECFARDTLSSLAQKMVDHEKELKEKYYAG